MSKPNLYVGCGLTMAPEQFRDQVLDLKNAMKGEFRVLEFLGLVNGSAVDVYHHDMECVSSADLFVAVCDYPSTGLGVELERARQLAKPTLAVAHTDSTITRLVLGMAEHEDGFAFERYQDMVLDVPRLVEVHLMPQFE